MAPRKQRKGDAGTWLGSSMPPFIPLCPPTHGIVPPTFWVSFPLGRLTISYMTENPANLMIQTDYHKDQVTKSNCISSSDEQSEDELHEECGPFQYSVKKNRIP